MMAEQIETKTTREVADELSVNPKTLQLWVREEHVTPITTGQGRQKRIAWTPEAVDQARRLRDRAAAESPLLAALGPELVGAVDEARRMKPYQFEGDVIVASAQAAKIYRDDTTLRAVLRQAKGKALLILP